MSRPRTIVENKGLPKGWRKRGESYRYQVPESVRHLWDGKKEFTLGKTLPEAYRVWADRMEMVSTSGSVTINQLLDRYLLEVVPTKAYRTQTANRSEISRIRKVFGTMYVENVALAHVKDFIELIIKKYGTYPGYHVRQCFSHVMTMALQWGYIENKIPISSVAVPDRPPRQRYITDNEVRKILSIDCSNRGFQLINLYLKFKLATGLRRSDILSIKLSDIGEEGIYVQPSKTRKTSSKKLVFTWDAGGYLESLVDEIKATIPRSKGDHLFQTGNCTPYINEKGLCPTFDSQWQRYVKKVMELTDITERFQERDFRAKVATESNSLQEASERLGHASTAITRKVYMRKPLAIEPLIRDYE